MEDKGGNFWKMCNFFFLLFLNVEITNLWTIVSSDVQRSNIFRIHNESLRNFLTFTNFRKNIEIIWLFGQFSDFFGFARRLFVIFSIVYSYSLLIVYWLGVTELFILHVKCCMNFLNIVNIINYFREVHNKIPMHIF